MSAIKMDESRNVLTIKTVQIQPIRNMITAIKDILTDVTIIFTKTGIKILNMDKTHTVIVGIELRANRFEKFVCHPEKIIICANTLQLFKVISTMSNDDTLSMYIDKDDYKDGIVTYLGLQYDNGDIKQCYSQKLRLIDADREESDIPEVTYSSIITLPTSDFQKIIRDLNNISDRIEIKSVGNQLTFSCEGPFAKSCVCRSESDGNMEFKLKPDEQSVVVGEFSLKSLTHFIKCTPLCSHLEMYLGNNLPLIVKYDVASLGEIKMCLSPLEN